MLECGYKIEWWCKRMKNKKGIIKFLVLILVMAIILVGAIFGVNKYNLYKSNESFEQAEIFESNNEIDLAIEHYSLVIPKDDENYEKATQKVEELSKLKQYVSKCAECWIATDTSCSYFDDDSVIAVYYAEDNTPYSAMYGKEAVTIISKFLNTECTFVISSRLSETLKQFYPYYYNNEYGVYVHAIGVENNNKGWLADGWNIVTDTYVDMAKSHCKEIDISLVEKCVEEKSENK